ncbi:HPF/RaiA family ribosome-associated protein [Azospirillum argentinense]|uniref:HPF/RaiA family ribosome-associated protein n=1 Tax=Azospirillum argentinense TaxID=2970906 RepID=UPI003D817165
MRPPTGEAPCNRRCRSPSTTWTPSPFLEACVREHAAKLERFFEHITTCHVVLDAPHRHHHKGKLYTVRIDLTVPGGELAVRHAKPADHAHERSQGRHTQRVRRDPPGVGRPRAPPQAGREDPYGVVGVAPPLSDRDQSPQRPAPDVTPPAPATSPWEAGHAGQLVHPLVFRSWS